MIKKFILKFYNESVESLCTRTLYFFNTLDTYFLFAGIVTVVIAGAGFAPFAEFVLMTLAVFALFRWADFYPVFAIFTPAFLYFLFQNPSLTGAVTLRLLGASFLVFVVIQFVFMSLPEAIVARDPFVGGRKLWNSVWTVAQTTVSLPVSLYFSMLYALVLVVRPSPATVSGIGFWVSLAAAALFTRRFRPKSFCSPEIKPEAARPVVSRVVVLNIDGCRLDRFYEARLPFLSALEDQSTYFPKGIQTVYRALTNPAFASILTGVPPEVHGVTSNNLGQRIRVEGLPDIVKTKLYGSMHVKHFSKPQWDTKIVSLPTHGIYKSDDIMLGWLKSDLLTDDGTRLFVADISETDFLGHAYGSESRAYLEALQRADRRIADFFAWLEGNRLRQDLAVIICSDHGMKRIDHSYLLFDAERYVPFFLTGPGIRPRNPLTYDASIMDIAATISYLLGVPYPAAARGRVFVEAFGSAA